MFDILRTSFHFLATQGLWVQAVHTAAPMQWVESPYDAKPNLAETLNPFLVATNEDEIFRRPPVFFHFLKGAAADDSHRLVVVLHHALYDGLSIATLFHVVEQLYRGVEVAPLSQYHQLLPRLLWQEKNGSSFWVNNLRSLAHASIPRRLSEHEGPATVHQYSLPIHIAEQELQRACRDAEVTPQCVGQTAFAKLLVVLTGRRDVVFGRVVSGRDLPGADEVVGPMLVGIELRVLTTHLADTLCVCNRIRFLVACSSVMAYRTSRSSKKCTTGTLLVSHGNMLPYVRSSESSACPVSGTACSYISRDRSRWSLGWPHHGSSTLVTSMRSIST